MIEPLSEVETRVLGALIEKSLTTPEYYPMTLNALVNACNQKSNRDPVVAYDEATVSAGLADLKEKGLIRVWREGRAPKYQQYFALSYRTEPDETALLCELMVRGPQTVGELRTRIERLGVIMSCEEVEAKLDALQGRPDGALVVQLPRQPGRKESRYAHLLSGEPVIPETSEGEAPPARASSADRTRALEEEVAALRQELATLREEFYEFRRQLE